MNFWQHILYRKEARKKLEHEIEYERNDKDLKYHIAKKNWIEEGHRKEKLYQRIFSAVLFLVGLALLMSDSKEMGFFLMGAGLYGLVPENDQKDQSKSNVNILKERWFWILIASLMMIVVIIISIIKIESPVDTKPVPAIVWRCGCEVCCCGCEICCCGYEICCCEETKPAVIADIAPAVTETKFKDSIGKLLWLFLGILTMLFITESKRVINSRA